VNWRTCRQERRSGGEIQSESLDGNVPAIDTSALIDALSGAGKLRYSLRRAIENGERLSLPTIVLYKRLMGPRVPAELIAQEALFPSDFGPSFRPWPKRYSVQKSAGRSSHRAGEYTSRVDIAIAAAAISHGAQLWTLNTADFADIPGLRLAKLRAVLSRRVRGHPKAFSSKLH